MNVRLPGLVGLIVAALTMGSALAAERVVVVGATSNTGVEAVRQAIAAGYKVVAGTRSIERAREKFGADIDWAVIDATDKSTIESAFKGADYIISSIGSLEPTGDNRPENVDYKGVVSMVDVAKQQGVKRFVLISSAGAGGDVKNRLNYIFNNILVWKWLGEDYLRDSELPYAVIRPGNLKDLPGGSIGIDLVQIDSTRNGQQIPRADVAAVSVECLKNADCLNKTFEVFSNPDAKPGIWKSTLATLKVDEKTKMVMPQR
jgi:uncharacterized protein YbjT (DUF2867 family)